jgi:23S rRNA (adenine-N6)-dimethyltransferase
MTTTTADMIRYWNESAGPPWVAMQERLDVQLEALGSLTRERAGIAAGARVLDVGCGCGSTTLELARVVGAGGRVVAVERDPVWADRLRAAAERAGVADRVEVVEADFRQLDRPRERYRVVANPPYNLTTALLAWLLDEPERGPWRADLVIQLEVARKHAAQPPVALRTAAWAPWWLFEHRLTIDRNAFRPVPAVDSALLTVHRRDPPVLPPWIATELRDLLRAGWSPPATEPGR